MITIQIDPQLVALIPDLKRKPFTFVRLLLVLQRNGSTSAKDGIQKTHSLLQWRLTIQGGCFFSEHLWTRQEPELSTVRRQHFPQVSVNLYSGKDWMTDRLDQWSQEAVWGKTSHSSPYWILCWMRHFTKLLLIGDEEIKLSIALFLPTTSFYRLYLSKPPAVQSRLSRSWEGDAFWLASPTTTA